MDLDVQVAKLRLLKSSHQSQKYHLEDRLLQYYPREIAATKAAIMGCEADVATRDAHPAPADIFAGIELRGAALRRARRRGRGTDATSADYYGHRSCSCRHIPRL